MPVVARASGDPITAGTVNFYLIADSGTNVGKWFKTSDNSWDAAEQVAGAGTHKADGTWQSSIDAEAWIDQASYTLYAKESGDLHVPLNAKVYCRHAYERQTGDSFARIGAAGAGLTDLGGMSTTMKAQVQAEAQDAIDSQGMSPDQYVLCARAATDALRGAALTAGIAAAKALTPGGAAISATNPAYVLVPPGQYDMTGEVTIAANTPGLRIVSTELVPITEADWWGDDEKVSGAESDLKRSRLRNTTIYRTDVTPVITQSADHLTLCGVDVVLRCGTQASYNADEVCALWITAASNAGSRYSHCFFWKDNPVDTTDTRNSGVSGENDIEGNWEWCLANHNAWRVNSSKSLNTKMVHTCGGGASFGGDADADNANSTTSIDGYFRDVHAKGCTIADTPFMSGYGSWGGCAVAGCHIGSNCERHGCSGGPHSCALGKTDAGKHFNDRSGYNSHGATVNNTAAAAQGSFTGYVEDAHNDTFSGLPNGSFGGTNKAVNGSYGRGSCSGTLKRVTLLGVEKPIAVTGAVIDQCLIVAGADTDLFNLQDDNSKITNSTLLVVEGGTGVPINAASALSVCAAGNRYNNLAAAALGLGANVTNVATEDRPLVADGLSENEALQTIMASVKGVVASPGSGRLEFYRRDGLTVDHTITYGDDDGLRTTIVDA